MVTPDCTTGVINELGGCEPVGVTPDDLQPINGPAVVDLPQPSIPDECWIDSNPANAIDDFVIYGDNPEAAGTHSISAMPCGPVLAETAQPALSLPTTGADVTVSAFAAVILAAGVLLARIATR